MSEVPQQDPLANHELAEHLDRQLDAFDQAQSATGAYDPAKVNYEPQAALQGSSQAYILKRVSDSSEKPFVTRTAEGEHKLETERLLVDASDLRTWVESDVRSLSAAIRNPKGARKQMLNRSGMMVPNDEIASDDLTRSEIHDYIAGGLRNENTAEVAMSNLSLRLVEELVKTWEHEAAMGIMGGALDRSRNRVSYGSSGIDRQVPLHQHLDAQVSKEDGLLAEFHKMHEANVRQLGKTATDAVGVRTRLGRTSGGTETASTAAAPRPEALHPAEDDVVAAAKRVIDPPSGERDRSAERLFDEVVRVGKGRTQLFAIFKRGQQHLGDSPEKERGIATGIPIINEDFNRVDWSKDRVNGWREFPNEAVSFTKLVDPTKVPRDLKERDDDEQEQILEAAQLRAPNEQGVDEPVVLFRYKFKYGVEARIAVNNGGELPLDRGYSGGRGGHISLAVPLPQSVAGRLQVQVEADPGSVRQLVVRLFTENCHKTGEADDAMPDVTPADWTDNEGVPSLRPPWPKLPKPPRGWDITVVDGYEASGDGANPIASKNFVKYNHRSLPVAA